MSFCNLKNVLLFSFLVCRLVDIKFVHIVKAVFFFYYCFFLPFIYIGKKIYWGVFKDTAEKKVKAEKAVLKKARKKGKLEEYGVVDIAADLKKFEEETEGKGPHEKLRKKDKMLKAHKQKEIKSRFTIKNFEPMSMYEKLKKVGNILKKAKTKLERQHFEKIKSRFTRKGEKSIAMDDERMSDAAEYSGQRQKTAHQTKEIEGKRQEKKARSEKSSSAYTFKHSKLSLSSHSSTSSKHEESTSKSYDSDFKDSHSSTKRKDGSDKHKEIKEGSSEESSDKEDNLSSKHNTDESSEKEEKPSSEESNMNSGDSSDGSGVDGNEQSYEQSSEEDSDKSSAQSSSKKLI